MPWSLGPRDWGCLSGRPVTHLFFQLLQVLFVSLGTADLLGDICSVGGSWVQWVWVAGWGL